MLGIDVYTLETLAPSLAMIGLMAGVMIYGAFKVVKLSQKDSNSERLHF
jgi:hypothetical protein